MKSFLLSLLLIFGLVGTAMGEPRGHAPSHSRPPHPGPGVHAPHSRPHYGSYNGFSFSFGVSPYYVTPYVSPYYVSPAPRLTRVYDALTGYYYYYDSALGVYYGPYIR